MEDANNQENTSDVAEYSNNIISLNSETSGAGKTRSKAEKKMAMFESKMIAEEVETDRKKMSYALREIGDKGRELYLGLLQTLRVGMNLRAYY